MKQTVGVVCMQMGSVMRDTGMVSMVLGCSTLVTVTHTQAAQLPMVGMEIQCVMVWLWQVTVVLCVPQLD